MVPGHIEEVVMQLILMRHAIAEERGASYPEDALRPLTKEGRRKHGLVSQALRRMGMRFTELLSSPLVRARQTAEITARVYEWPREIIETDVLGAGFSIPAARDLFSQFPNDATLLCVGHEPDLSTLAARLLHPSGDVEIAFKKSGVMGLDLPEGPRPGAALLLYFFKPGQLTRLARGA
jgi:phosphohistidine phosphatase